MFKSKYMSRSLGCSTKYNDWNCNQNFVYPSLMVVISRDAHCCKNSVASITHVISLRGFRVVRHRLPVQKWIPPLRLRRRKECCQSCQSRHLSSRVVRSPDSNLIGQIQAGYKFITVTFSQVFADAEAPLLAFLYKGY